MVMQGEMYTDGRGWKREIWELGLQGYSRFHQETGQRKRQASQSLKCVKEPEEILEGKN